MAFTRKPFMGMKEREIISDLYGSQLLRHRVPGLANVQDAVQAHRALVEEINALGELRRKYGNNIRTVAGMDVGTWIACEEFHKAGCSCGRPVMGPDGHKEWFFYFLDLPGVRENHDLRTDSV